MNYTIRSMNGRYALFFTMGSGKKMVSSFLFDEGKIKLFAQEQEAVQVGDSIKLRKDFGSCNCDVPFMKALDK